MGFEEPEIHHGEEINDLQNPNLIDPDTYNVRRRDLPNLNFPITHIDWSAGEEYAEIDFSGPDNINVKVDVLFDPGRIHRKGISHGTVIKFGYFLDVEPNPDLTTLFNAVTSSQLYALVNIKKEEITLYVDNS